MPIVDIKVLHPTGAVVEHPKSITSFCHALILKRTIISSLLDWFHRRSRNPSFDYHIKYLYDVSSYSNSFSHRIGEVYLKIITI